MITLQSYHTPDGVKTVLAKEGRKRITVLMMTGSGLVARKLPKEEQRYMRDVIGLAKSWTTVCRQFGGFARRHGSTKEARKFLAEARRQST